MHSTLHFACLAVGITLFAACSGASTQDVLATDGASSSSSSSGSTGSSSGSSSSGGSSSGALSDAGGATDAASPCTPEQEPNDDSSHANVLAPSRCGKVGRRDKVDFLTFRLAPKTTSVELRFDGKVRLQVSVNGAQSVELTPNASAEIPFVKDADYTVQITPFVDATTDLPWRVDLVER